MSALTEWQRRFAAAPSVWMVYYRDTEGEEPGNVYATREGAELEIKWRRRIAPKSSRYFVREIKVHTDELSRERWKP